MSSSWKWKFSGTLFAILLSVYLLIPSVFDFQGRIGQQENKPSLLAQYFPKNTINLGLDLRGGMYLEMDVDLDDAVKTHLDLLITQMERLGVDDGFADLKLTPKPDSHGILVNLRAEQQQPFLDFLRKNFVDGDGFTVLPKFVDNTFPAENGTFPAESGFEVRLSDEYVAQYSKRVLRQALGAVSKRIDRYGVAEASIQYQGENRLVIELPGVSDPDRVIDLIKQTGRLEFKVVDVTIAPTEIIRMVAEVRTAQNIDPEDFSRAAVQKINEALKDKIPAEREILYQIDRDPVTNVLQGGTPMLVHNRADVTGDMISQALVGIDDNQPHVRISLDRVGAKNFAKVTQENVNRPFAIILDDVIFNAPNIQEAILSGEARITMGFGGYDTLKRESEDLALLLREGALPARLTVATKTLIGPSLGLQSIKMGLNSMLIASIVIILFMMIYYRLGGVVSSFALILNVLFIFAILSIFQASLTLPGMAGIVLTLGMAVDANIIIFERMREERRLGKSAQEIVESGYTNARSSIIDGNLTTLIVGIVLFQFGTGPVKGFATTLMIGIFTTLFTALIVTRIIYDYYLFKVRIKNLYI